MIEINDVKFRYKNKKELFINLNLKINKGEIIAIIGKNGSGKSTLIKILAGLLKPEKGKVYIDGIDMYDKKNYLDVRKKVGMVFQNPDDQILFNKVKTDMEFGIKNIGLEEINTRVTESLEFVGMQDYVNAETFKLSLGQKQKINIASALAIKPEYLILDEPTSMIDSRGKEKVYDVIKKITNEKKSVIFVTNNINEIILADKIIIIDDGKINKIINKLDILKNIDLLENLEVCVPDTIKLINNLNKNGFNISLEEYTFEEISRKVLEVAKNEEFV